MLSSETTPKITTTIRDQNGHNISPAFKKMIYYHNPKGIAADSHNAKDSNSVQVLNTCGAAQGLFVESFCNYEDGLPGSVRAYTYKCLNYRKGVRNRKVGSVEVVAYRGSCGDHEICVNSEGREGDWSSGSSITAFCISTDALVASTDEDLIDLSGTTLTALLTSPDMTTPLKSANIDIKTEVSSSNGTIQHGIEKDCVQCLSVTTNKLVANTTSIALSETWLMARAVTLASMAGVLIMIILAI